MFVYVSRCKSVRWWPHAVVLLLQEMHAALGIVATSFCEELCRL